MKKHNVKDFYFYKAKKENFSARSVYKLNEINDKYKIISSGDRVLDLGASPGSWSEFLAPRLGPQGQLIALDLKPLSLKAIQTIERSKAPFMFLQQSVYDPLPHFSERLDVVVSDMAPDTNGNALVDCLRSKELMERAFDLAGQCLKDGGRFVVKIFQFPDTMELAKTWEKHFEFSKLQKPAATHKESREIYFVGKGFNL